VARDFPTDYDRHVQRQKQSDGGGGYHDAAIDEREKESIINVTAANP
jgi:hypothetical protein